MTKSRGQQTPVHMPLCFDSDTRELAESMAARIGGVPSVRPELVARLRRQLATGHYAPSAERVADRLVGPLLSERPGPARSG